VGIVPKLKLAAMTYLVEPGISRFTVRGTAGGMLSGLGHNPLLAIRDYAGKLTVDPEAPDRSIVRLTIQAASLEVQNDASEKDRREMKRVMDEEILEVAAYPEIVFESTRISAQAPANPGDYFRAEVEGNLSLHGVTRPLRAPASVTIQGDMLRSNGEFTIKQTDYRIKLASVAGGVLKLKDELKFAFDIVARKAEA
jgi:polyisoprenoid-binding protein YceI